MSGACLDSARDALSENGDLDAAWTALEHGRAKHALRIAWKAAIRSTSKDDPTALERTIELAAAIRDRSTGPVHDEAVVLLDYCRYTRENREPARFLGFLLRGREERRKVCPACGKTSLLEARFCPSCGSRFDGGS